MSTLAFISIEPKMLRTQERIMLAAMKVFSQHPLDSASLRLIAKEAGITLSSITYHYKTKENLYREVLNRVLSYMTQDIEERVETIRNQKSLSPEQAEQILRDLILYFVDRMFGPHSSIFAKIIIQEHFSPTIFYSEIYEQYFKKVIDLIEHLISRITGERITRQTTLTAFSVFGQIVGFRMERELLFKRFDTVGFTPEEIEPMRKMLVQNALKMVDSK